MNRRDSLAARQHQAGGQQATTAACLVRPGKTLERLITSEQTLPNREVVLTHVGQAARRIGEGKVVAVKGPVDFFGTVRGSGRSILFDAKECGKPSFDCNTSAVKQHQINELVRHGRAGALAGLLILDTRSGWVVWLDWRKLEQRKPTYPWDDLEYAGTLHGVNWTALCRSLAGEVAS